MSFSYVHKNIVFLVLIIYFLYKVNNKTSISHSNSKSAISSSIYCSIYKNNSKRCMFKNLCYNFYSNFIFVLTKDSVISGLYNKHDFKHIYATSVLNHSALPLKISIINANNFSNVFFYETDVFLLHRFKPDNIMHVIHDDIFPLYTTYRDLCFGNITDCILKYDIIFSDENDEENFIEWYEGFSKSRPFQLSKLNKSVTYCFSRVNVGLSIDSVFFQYGFQQSRGSTGNSVHQVQLLKQFRSFMLNQFQINNFNMNFQAVFMARKLNRKILNEDYVENVILECFKKEFNISLTLLNMDLSINSSKEILGALSKANYLIGMHGSAMFLSMFLPENSVVIEMFPYGITKESVSPIFVMSSMPDIWFRYFSWENNNQFNSFPHPEYLPIFGGLSNLNREKQIHIFSEKLNIPSTKCCNDPLFLSRMYQDTLVDETFMETINFTFKTADDHKKLDLNEIYMQEWFFPGVVQNVSCYRNNDDLLLNWDPPFNINFDTNVTYDIAVETSNQNLSVFTNNYSLQLKLGSQISKIKIWIKCIFLGNESVDTFILC